MIPHNTPAQRSTINVMVEGKKVGTAILSANGTLSASITDPVIAELISPSRELQHISITPTYKKQ